MTSRRHTVDLLDARLIGLISDTHGKLRPEAVDYLAGVDAILHAGDVGGRDILERLATIAPVYAVRGNVDYGAYADALSHEIVASCGSKGQRDGGRVCLYMVHQPEHIRPGDVSPHIVMHGHTHMPRLETRDGVTYVNPGSAGPRRFDKPITVGRLELRGDEPVISLWDLAHDRAWLA